MERAVVCWIPLLLAAVGLGVCRESYTDMEDAFADEDAECPRSVKSVFCRLGRSQKSTLEAVNKCLCTHFIYDEDSSVNLEHLRGSNAHLVPSFRLEDLLLKEERGSGTAADYLLDRIRSQKQDEVDIVIAGDTEPQKAQTVLVEVVSRLRGDNNSSAGKVALRLTFTDNIPTVEFVAVILRNTDVASFTFFTDMAQDEAQTFGQLEQISKLDVPLNKTFFGISLAAKNGTRLDLFPKLCPELSLLRNSEEATSRGDDSRVMRNLRIKVEYVKQSTAKGIALWSLAEDDVTGICGMGPFPVLQNIWDLLNRSPSTFDDFADLDIVMSTGESQERFLLQDLEDNPEEMKKLPCKRVGFYRHPEDCTKFYHCSEYRTTKINHTGPYAGFLYKCPEGLIYDERQESCIWPSMSDPCKGSGELLPVPTKKYACAVPGFHVDPENCRWFYYCSDLGDGKLEAFEFLCPSDLLGYDEKQMLCNWKWTVSACVNSEKQPETNARTFFSPETNQKITNKLSPQGRTAKALNVQGIQNPPSSQTPTRSLKLSGKQGTDENNTISEDEIHFIQINRNIPTHEVSFSPNVENTGYFRNNPARVDTVVGDILPNGKLMQENQTYQDKNIGTAVWRRSWINTGRDNRKITSIPDPFKDDFPEGFLVNIEKDDRNSNQNNVAADGKSTENVPTNNRRERIPFQGRTRKFKLNTGVHAPESREKDEDSFTREISGRNQNTNINLLQIFSHEQKGNTVHNSTNRSHNRESEILSIQSNAKSDPFASVRCAKLGDTYGEQDFGCTSEVSLTIHMKDDKNAAKYVLKEEQIRRTGYQESQQIQYLKNPTEKRLGNNFQTEASLRQNTTYENTPEIPINASYFLQSSENIQKERELQTSRKKSSDVFDLETKNLTLPLEISKNQHRPRAETNIYKEHSIQARPEHLRERQRTQTAKIISNPNIRYSEYFIQNSEPLDNRAMSREIENADIKNKTEHRRHHNGKTMPVHFYPQGVLLNIDLAHINEIPPQILLEVDNMLKRYMKEGDIDINLLEMKLNATKGNMTKKESRNMEPEEIMEMIKVIENVINTTKDGESETLRTNPSHGDVGNASKPSDRTDANKDTKLEAPDYENVTSFAENGSLGLGVHGAPSRDIVQITNKGNKNGANDFKISEKIQNSEISRHTNTDQINAMTTPRPFGRRRLIRKFKYPSIREQLERRNQYQNAPRVSDTSTTLFGVTENAIGEMDTSFMHSSTYNWMQSDHTRTNVSPPQHTRTNVSPSTRQQLERQNHFLDNRNSNYGNTPSAAVTENINREFDASVSFIHPSTKNWIQPEHMRLDSGLNNRHGATNMNHEVPMKPNENHIQRDLYQNYGYRVQTAKEYDTSKQTSDLFNTPPLSSFVREIEHTQQHRTRENRHSNSNTRHNSRSDSDYSNSPPLSPFLSDTGHTQPHIARQNRHSNSSNTRYGISSDYSDSPQLSSSVSETEQPEQHRIRENRYRNSNTRHNSHSDSSSNIKFENEQSFFNNYGHSDVNSRVTFSTDYLEPNYVSQPVKTVSRQSDIYAGRQYNYNQVSSADSRSVMRSRTEYNEDFASELEQGRKKRKIRILVRKLINSDTDSEHDPSSNHGKNTATEQIPENVLNNLKNKFLKKLAEDGSSKIELQIQFQDHVWNVPFVNGQLEADLSPSICTRAGLFQHPRDCTMFYECFWDKWLQRFTLHVFSCPVRLVYDDSVRGCSRPTSDSHCRPSK